MTGTDFITQVTEFHKQFDKKIDLVRNGAYAFLVISEDQQSKKDQHTMSRLGTVLKIVSDYTQARMPDTFDVVSIMQDIHNAKAIMKKTVDKYAAEGRSYNDLESSERQIVQAYVTLSEQLEPAWKKDDYLLKLNDTLRAELRAREHTRYKAMLAAEEVEQKEPTARVEVDQILKDVRASFIA